MKNQDSKYDISEITNLNTLALKEFIQLIKSSDSIDPTWDKTITGITNDGFPINIKKLEKLIDTEE